MKLKRLGVILLSCLGFAGVAHANEVLLTANQPMKITFRVACQLALNFDPLLALKIDPSNHLKK